MCLEQMKVYNVRIMLIHLFFSWKKSSEQRHVYSEMHFVVFWAIQQ